MRATIQAKILFLCLFLVLLTTIGTSTGYYLLARASQKRESRNSIQIAFDIILDDIHTRITSYQEQFDEFLAREATAAWTASLYNQNKEEIGSRQFVISYLVSLAGSFKDFGSISAVNRLMLFTEDGRLLMAYQRDGSGEHIGAYLKSSTGQDTYFSLDNTAEISSIMYTGAMIPDRPISSNIPVHYADAIPDKTTVTLLARNSILFFSVEAPLYRKNQKVGVMVGEIEYKQGEVARYAALSKTDVNLFAGNQFSLGTLPEETIVQPVSTSQGVACDALFQQTEQQLFIYPVNINNHAYFQGQCLIMRHAETVGAISVSLSQKLERDELQGIFTTVITFGAISVLAAFVLSYFFSHRTIHSIQNIVNVIGLASEGDLRQSVMVKSHDEFGMLAQQLNRMIQQLRSISRQVQDSSSTVGVTADAILREIESLTQRIEQQSTSVDYTTESVKRIDEFIKLIGENTADLSASAQQTLSSIHQIRASRLEVTTSIGHLAGNMQTVLAAVEQIGKSSKNMSEHIGDLEGVARQTATAMQRIDVSLKDVSDNAMLSQQLADDTREAARKGQDAVDASIEGMRDLKHAVSNTAQIIQEVNSWGEQVSSILDIVDEITAQTSLLALNASIISAQAGSHGRGFAVVADEIKELALRTKNSTQRISALIHTLRKKTEEGVKHMNDGLKKAEQGMGLASAVKEALDTILERATNASERAGGTAKVVQNTAASSQLISASMGSVTNMVSQVNGLIQQQEEDITQVVLAIENSQAMSAQINQASIQQNQNSAEIEKNMQHMAERVENISQQAEELHRNSAQIVEAMHAMEIIAEHLLRDIMTISSQTANDLVKQSEMLDSIVQVFKVL